jgi:internalin A
MKTTCGLSAVLTALVGGVVFMFTDEVRQDEKKALEYLNALGALVFRSDQAPESFKKHLEKDFGKAYFVILSDTKVKDNDLEVLKSLGPIAIIKLNVTSISDRGLQALTRADLSKLVQLELSGTKITNDCSSFFRCTPMLKNLDVSGTHIGDKFVEEIARICSRLEILEISEVKITDKSIPLLSKLKLLKSLNLSATEITNKEAKMFQELRELEVLSLSDTKVAVGIGKILSRTSDRVRYISLAGTGIDDSDLSALASIKSLVRLDLQNTNISDKGVMELASLSNLRILALGNTKVTAKAREFLRAHIPDVKYQSLPYVERKEEKDQSKRPK